MLKNLIIITSAAAAVATMSAVANAGNYRPSGAEILRKIMKPHYFRYHISPSVKAAAGNRNMAVYDYRRGFNDGPYRCSYINSRGKRAIVCE